MKKRSSRILLGLLVTAFVFNYIWPERAASGCLIPKV